MGEDQYDNGRSHTSTLGGVVELAEYDQSGANFWYDDPHHETPIMQYTLGISTERYRVYGDHDRTCSSFSDPRDDVLRQLNAIMFYAGITAAKVHNTTYLRSRMDPGLHVNATTTGHVQGNHNVYHTNLHWFAVAALVEGICIALILPTYLGWWKLGRPMSFSPIEVAKVR